MSAPTAGSPFPGAQRPCDTAGLGLTGCRLRQGTAVGSHQPHPPTHTHSHTHRLSRPPHTHSHTQPLCTHTLTHRLRWGTEVGSHQPHPPTHTHSHRLSLSPPHTHPHTHTHTHTHTQTQAGDSSGILSGPCSHSRAIPSFPSQLEWKIGLPWANTRGILNSPS